MAQKTKPEDFQSMHDLFDFKKLRDYFMSHQDTKDTARGLGVPLGEYVDAILERLEDPKKEAELELLTEEQLLLDDPDYPLTEANILKGLELIMDGTVPIQPQMKTQSEFSGTASTFDKVGGQGAVSAAPANLDVGEVTAKDKEIGDALKDALAAERMRKK